MLRRLPGRAAIPSLREPKQGLQRATAPSRWAPMGCQHRGGGFGRRAGRQAHRALVARLAALRKGKWGWEPRVRARSVALRTAYVHPRGPGNHQRCRAAADSRVSGARASLRAEPPHRCPWRTAVPFRTPLHRARRAPAQPGAAGRRKEWLKGRLHKWRPSSAARRRPPAGAPKGPPTRVAAAAPQARAAPPANARARPRTTVAGRRPRHPRAAGDLHHTAAGDAGVRSGQQHGRAPRRAHRGAEPARVRAR